MNFVWKANNRLLTPEQVAKVIYDVAVARGLGKVYAHCATACVAVESDFWCPWNAADPSSKNFPYDSQSDDGRSVGYYQQQNAVAGPVPSPQNDWWGPMSSRMDLAQATDRFLSRMNDGLDYSMGKDRLGTEVANTQGCAPAYRGRYAEEWDRAGEILDRALKGAPAPSQPQEQPSKPEEPPVADSRRPDFNEFALWSPNSQLRGNTKPRLAIVHTQEPTPNVIHGPVRNDAAEALGKYCLDPAKEVSYHYYVSQADDGGVTVVDGVDTDHASWSVGNANNDSINYCFAGSYAGWTRADWMKYADKSIDVVAYLIAQDIKKYPSIKPNFLGTGGDYGNSQSFDSGVTDHQWVTDVFGWGSHTDCGPGFPGDYLWDRVLYWLNDPAPQAPEPQPAPKPATPAETFLKWVTDRQGTTDRDLLEYIALQVGTGHPAWPTAGKTVRDEVFGR